MTVAQQESPRFFLFSDGGGWQTSSAGAACIVIDQETGQETKIVAYLGGATNNEAEITAALLGFSFLRALLETSAISSPTIRWISDSEYTLKGATEYIHKWQKNGWKTAQKISVKNQGLWRAFLHITPGMKIFPEHVKGHAGHPENEACDGASTWVQQQGLKTLSSKGEGSIINFGNDDFESNWILIDGREFLQGVRDNYPDAGIMELLIDKFRGEGMSGRAATIGTKPVKGSAHSENKSHDEWQQLLMTLASAKERAITLANNRKSPPVAEQLAEDIAQLLKKYGG